MSPGTCNYWLGFLGTDTEAMTLSPRVAGRTTGGAGHKGLEFRRLVLGKKWSVSLPTTAASSDSGSRGLVWPGVWGLKGYLGPALRDSQEDETASFPRD